MISRANMTAFIKVFASLACLVVMWRAFIPTNWGEVLKRLDPWLGLAAVAILLVGQVANGYRHWAVLVGLRRRISPGTILALTSAGMFFNQVLPSGLGGDVVRIVNLRTRCGWRRATASVLLDRIVGVSFNLALVALLLPFYGRLNIPVLAKAGVAALSTGPLLVLSCGIWASRWRRARRWLPRPLRFVPYLLILLRRLVRPLSLLRLIPSTSIGFFSYVAAFALIGDSLGAATTTIGYMMMVPLIFIAAQFPLSFGGWGVREGAAIALMPLVGMESGVAFLTSFLFGVAVLITSLPGLLIWSLSRFDPTTPDATKSAAHGAHDCVRYRYGKTSPARK
jgi:uncharacterized membrane protein YbhN (UPF0104 family)